MILSLAADGVQLIGIDEVGRGCLAGPVVAAAVGLNAEFFKSRKRRNICLEVRDSKQLSAERREALLEAMEAWAAEDLLQMAIAEGTVEEIEQFNILAANTLAMRRALEGLLLGEIDWGSPEAPKVLIDGKPVKRFGYPHDAIVKGDDKSLGLRWPRSPPKSTETV